MSNHKAKAIRIFSENNVFQHFTVLKTNRQKRQKYAEFFVEGVRNINEAFRNRWPVKTLVYCADRPLSDWAAGILDSQAELPRYSLTAPLMAGLSDKEDTSELIAIVGMPPDDPARLNLAGNFILLVFDRPSNKGNLGTLIRSGDALGADGLIITGHSVDLYDPETIRASMGSLFKFPAIRLPSFNELSQWINNLKTRFPALKVAGTSEKGVTSLEEFDFARPLVILIGNEAEGLSWNFEKMSDIMLRIPMSRTSSASSLNVACAASIFLYEISRQRRT